MVPVHEPGSGAAGAAAGLGLQASAGTPAGTGVAPWRAPRARADRAVPMAAAWKALQTGRIDAAYALAEAALARAESARQPALQAAALTVQAHVLRLRAEVSAAYRIAQRAAAQYRELHDAAGEAQALVQVAHVASSLGHTDEAVEAALLAVRLQEPLPGSALQASAYNALGAAYFWSGGTVRARAAFEAAVESAQRHGPAGGAFQPLVNLMFCEAARLAGERYHGGRLPPTGELQAVHGRCRRALDDGGGVLAPGLEPIAQACYSSLAALAACWGGAVAEAESCLAEAQRALSALRHGNWLHALGCWARAETAWARGDAMGAERGFDDMLALAGRAEHEQMACLAHMSAAALLAQRGHSERALAHVRRLGLRQERMRAASLDSRDRAVHGQLAARQREQEHERRLDDLRQHSQHYQRLALEDALTGVANRRALDEALRALLEAGPPRQCCVALVDVDRFKSVNDRHSHQVGDRVLQRLAALLRAHLRGHDLVARLGGDEFVLLLQADADAAAGVCERVRRAVAEFDWTALAPALRISVSIGLAAARADDDTEALLHRADTAMYGCKRRTHARSEAAATADAAPAAGPDAGA